MKQDTAHDMLEEYPLRSLAVDWNGQQTILRFRSAVLIIDKTDSLELGWFIDISGLENTELLAALSRSPDIRITLSAFAGNGEPLSGIGYMHPNLAAGGAAIKGDGELHGYALLGN